MDFGISLDPLSVTQRHAVYDSDEEEQEEAEGTAENFFIRGTSSSSESCTLLIALGQVSVTFVRSFLILEDQPTFLLSSRTSKVVKGLHFPARSHEGEGGQELPDPVSSVYVARGKQPGSGEEGLFLVCTHEKVLKSEYCNLWAAKVNLVTDCTINSSFLISPPPSSFQLFKHLRPSSTLILDSTPFHEHFSPYPDNPDHGSFSRSLQSSNWPHPPTAAFLEPPNTVKGEAAAGVWSE